MIFSRRMEAGAVAMLILPLWPNASTLRLSAQPTGIVGHDVETSRQRALGLALGSFALAEFTVNVSLPDFVGLGKGGSVGWGVVKELRQ